MARSSPPPKPAADAVERGRPIVSSAHLVSPHSAEMSEFEFGLIVAGNAFHRWVTHCMSAAGLKDLTALDVLVLHHVSHRARDKRLSDIATDLVLSPKTVSVYRARVLEKLQLTNNSELTVYAIRNGLVGQ